MSRITPASVPVNGGKDLALTSCMTLHLFRTFSLGLGIATVFSLNGIGSTGETGANSQNDRTTQDSRPNAPLTVTGCLQRDGHTFIVTRRNEPAQKNAGSTGNGAAVEREQLRAAANAYRISPAERMDLDKMVGKEVRVSGTLAKSADLPSASASDKREDIYKGNLAEIKATAVSIVAESCGGRAAPE